MEEKEITLNQALEAEQYVKTYMKFIGMDPFDIDEDFTPPENWPADVKSAWETYSLYFDSLKEEDIIA